MTTYAIFGETEASEKLVRASLSDLLDTHLQFNGDEDFILILAGSTDTLSAVQAWASEASVPASYVNSPQEAVEAAWSIDKSKASVLALLGDN